MVYFGVTVERVYAYMLPYIVLNKYNTNLVMYDKKINIICVLIMIMVIMSSMLSSELFLTVSVPSSTIPPTPTVTNVREIYSTNES